MLVLQAEWVHLFPFRTEKLSTLASMILAANSRRESRPAPTSSAQSKTSANKRIFCYTTNNMTKRSQVVMASALLVAGVGLAGVAGMGGTTLSAASVGQAGIDLTKYFLWGGVALLVVSALLYLRASAE